MRPPAPSMKRQRPETMLGRRPFATRHRLLSNFAQPSQTFSQKWYIVRYSATQSNAVGSLFLGCVDATSQPS